MGLIGGLAAASVLHEGCTQTCELNLQTLILMCVIVLVAAIGAWYVIRHSGYDTAGKKEPPSSSGKPPASPL